MDSEGRNLIGQKQVIGKSGMVDDLGPISLFQKDKHFFFIHQKAMKLVSALYIITEHFPENEPSKWSLRNLGSELIKLATNLNLEMSQVKFDVQIRRNVLEISSLLDAGSVIGLISSMNLSIIKKEFMDLLNYIQVTKKDRDSRGFRIGKNFFETLQSPETERNSADELIEVARRRKISDDVIKDKNSIPYAGQSSVATSNSKTNVLKDFSTVAVKRNKRQSIIIGLVKREKEIMVKDVAEIIQDCSEKTIQRELAFLVKDGILAKEGERRWTKYRLA